MAYQKKSEQVYYSFFKRTLNIERASGYFHRKWYINLNFIPLLKIRCILKSYFIFLFLHCFPNRYDRNQLLKYYYDIDQYLSHMTKNKHDYTNKLV